MVHVHCMVEASAYKHTLRIFNTYCLSTITMVARICLNVTFIHTLPVMLIACHVSSQTCNIRMLIPEIEFKR